MASTKCQTKYKLACALAESVQKEIKLISKEAKKDQIKKSVKKNKE